MNQTKSARYQKIATQIESNSKLGSFCANQSLQGPSSELLVSSDNYIENTTMDKLKPPEISRSMSQESGASNYTDALESFEDDDDEIFDEDYMYEPHVVCSEEVQEPVVHPYLYRDIENLIFIYGENAVDYRLFESIDEIDVDLLIPLRFLDETTADAWKVNKNEPLIVRLHFSLSRYLESSVAPKIEVFQPSKRERFGFGCQVRKFLENFVSKEWGHVYTDYLKCVEEEGKRKPSLSSSQMLLPGGMDVDRAASMFTDETIAKLVEMGFETDLARNALVITHGNVNEASELLLKKPEDLVENQTFESVQQTFESASGKPSGPERSISEYSGVSMDEDLRNMQASLFSSSDSLSDAASDDFKSKCKDKVPEQKSLKRQLSHPPILNKLRKMLPSLKRTISMLPGKQDGSFSSRQVEDLNLMPLSTLNGQNAKTNIPSVADGFLVQVFRYVRQRIPTINEYCVVCDEPHIFQNGAMLKPAVCSRELCVFAFQTLGVMADAAEDIATGAEVVDLLINMTRAASRSTRKHVIFDPFPNIVDPKNPCNLLFTDSKPDYVAVERVISEIPLMEDIASMTSELKKKLDDKNPGLYPVIQWIITSNRSHIVKLPVERQLGFMHTPYQFLLVSSPPAKEAEFWDAKKKHGSTFAFHGSGIENWHSIIRQGLLNASGTKHQMNGAAYGKGIYLSPCISTSMGYSRMGYGCHNVKKNSTPKAEPQRFLSSQNITCIALCEVITSPDLKKNNSIWVCPKPEHVCTRFFFVYEDGRVGDSNVNTQEKKYLDQIKVACGYSF